MIEQDIKILQENRYCQEKPFKQRYLDTYNRILEHAKQLNINNWNEARYSYLHQMNSVPTCKICSKPVKFANATKGYKNTCSRECDIQLKAISNKAFRNAKKTKCSTAE